LFLVIQVDPIGNGTRVVYGFIPFCAGLLALAISSWTAARYNSQADPVNAIKRNLLYGVIGIVLVFVSLIFNDLYIHFPVRIP